MEIIAHRGLWNSEVEKNSLESLKEAICQGFGIETDIRDFQGKLVISHNIADASCPELESLLEYYRQKECRNRLALNVKADGLQEGLLRLLKAYQIRDYFLFDMSVPEMVSYQKSRLRFFTRNSDIERECVMYPQAAGVWMDTFFEEEWLTEAMVKHHVGEGKEVCIVSPEIHGYGYLPAWDMLKRTGLCKHQGVSLCTDLPKEARRYFGQ